jgi:aminopeptidase YwaD
MRFKAIVPTLISGLMLAGSLSCLSQEREYARQVVNTLASSKFKGRGYVQDGAKIASEYIAGEFKRAGLIPLNQKSYFQDFNLSVNTFPGKMQVRLNNQLLHPGADYLIDASSPAVHGSFPVFSLKLSDSTSSEKLNQLLAQAQGAFILLDARGEVVRKTAESVGNTTKAALDKTSKAEKAKAIKAALQSSIQQVFSAKSASIKGLIVLTGEKLTWTTLTYQTELPLITVSKNDLDTAKISKITVDVDARFFPEYSTRNVAGMVKGSSNTDSTIVISAHYDHLGMMGEKVYFPGANDNASGTAMMLSFARYFSTHKPKYNTVFLAFSGEEIGLLGSKAFVEKPLIPLNKIKFLINFDLAGTGDEGIKVVNGSIFKEKFDTLVALNNTYKLLSKIAIRGEACISDHCRFYALGVPSFFIYTQGGIQAYHDIYDRPETLPLTAFENYFKLMIKFLDTL